MQKTLMLLLEKVKKGPAISREKYALSSNKKSFMLENTYDKGG